MNEQGINSLTLEGFAENPKLIERDNLFYVKFNLIYTTAGAMLCVFKFHNKKRAKVLLSELSSDTFEKVQIVVSGCLRNQKRKGFFVLVKHIVVLYTKATVPKTIPADYVCTPPSCPQDIDDAWDMED